MTSTTNNQPLAHAARASEAQMKLNGAGKTPKSQTARVAGMILMPAMVTTAFLVPAWTFAPMEEGTGTSGMVLVQTATPGVQVTSVK